MHRLTLGIVGWIAIQMVALGTEAATPRHPQIIQARDLPTVETLHALNNALRNIHPRSAFFAIDVAGLVFSSRNEAVQVKITDRAVVFGDVRSSDAQTLHFFNELKRQARALADAGNRCTHIAYRRWKNRTYERVSRLHIACGEQTIYISAADDEPAGFERIYILDVVPMEGSRFPQTLLRPGDPGAP